MAKKKTTLTASVRIDGMRETLAAFNRLPKDANDALRDKSMELAQALAGEIAAAGRSEGRQAAILAATVKARRDRAPVVVAGGAKRVGRNREPAYALLFGSEFGMNKRTGWYARPRFDQSSGRQYKAHRGRQGYWFFPTIEKNADEIAAVWRKAADDLIAKFGGV